MPRKITPVIVAMAPAMLALSSRVGRQPLTARGVGNLAGSRYHLQLAGAASVISGAGFATGDQACELDGP